MSRGFPFSTQGRGYHSSSSKWVDCWLPFQPWMSQPMHQQNSLQYTDQTSCLASTIVYTREIKTVFIFNSNNIITKSYTVHGSIKTSLNCPFPSFHLLSSMTLSDSNYLAQPEVASSYSGGNSTNPSLPLFSTLVPCTTVESECRMMVGSLLNPGLAPYISLSSEWIE